MMARRAILGGVILAGLGGCSDLTHPSALIRVEPEGPASFDGGWTVGSGGRSDSTSTSA